MSAVGLAPSARSVLAAAEARLAAAGVPTPRVDAEWLLAGLLGIGRGALSARLEAPLPGAVAARFEAALARRSRREPLQQILGWEEFRGLRLAVTPDVLIPRPETEVLVEAALGLLPPPAPGRRLRVVDVGTGSGCIACAIARERPDAEVLALDASPAALAVARANAGALGLAGRVRLLRADLLEALAAGGADLAVANPPYLPTALVPSLEPEVREHEPRLALDGGADGLGFVRRVIAGAARALAPGGGLALETAGREQAHTAAGLLGDAGFTEVSVTTDLTGTERIVTARRTPAA